MKAAHMQRTLLVALALAAAVPLASAQDYPKLKPGQWEITMDAGNRAKDAKPVKTTMCVDEVSQQQMYATGMGAAREACSKNDFRRDGTRYIGYSECKFGDSKTVGRTLMTLTGDTAYHVEVKSTYDPPFMGMKEAQTTLDGKHVGACRDGLVPGDIVMPGGQKINVKDFGKARTPPPKSSPNATQNAPAKKAAQ